MKLLLEMISDQVADRLSARGYDCSAVTARPELRSLDDPDIFARAQEEGRAIVTYNVQDFGPIVRGYAESGREHAGAIFVSGVRIPPGDLSLLSAALDRLLKTFEPWPSFVTWLQGPS